MNVYQLVLYLHLCGLLIAIAASTLVHFSESRLCASSTVAEVRVWDALLARVVRAFPVAIIVLVGSGGYMVHAAWNWHEGWVEAGLLGIGLLIVNGPILAGSRHRRIRRFLAGAGDGPVTPALVALVRDPLLHAASWANTALALGIVLVMVAKLSLEASVSVLAVALLVGAGVALSLRRAGRTSVTAPG